MFEEIRPRSGTGSSGTSRDQEYRRHGNCPLWLCCAMKRCDRESIRVGYGSIICLENFPTPFLYIVRSHSTLMHGEFMCESSVSNRIEGSAQFRLFQTPEWHAVDFGIASARLTMISWRYDVVAPEEVNFRDLLWWSESVRRVGCNTAEKCR